MQSKFSKTRQWFCRVLHHERNSVAFGNLLSLELLWRRLEFWVADDRRASRVLFWDESRTIGHKLRFLRFHLHGVTRGGAVHHGNACWTELLGQFEALHSLSAWLARLVRSRHEVVGCLEKLVEFTCFVNDDIWLWDFLCHVSLMERDLWRYLICFADLLVVILFQVSRCD